MFTAVITNPAVAPTILTVLKTHVIPARAPPLTLLCSACGCAGVPLPRDNHHTIARASSRAITCPCVPCTPPLRQPTCLSLLTPCALVIAEVNSSGVPANAVNSIPTYNSAVNLSSTVANGFVTFRTAFSSANVTRADVFAPGCSTATIHVINAVLLPIDPTPLVGPVAALVASMTPPPAARPNPPPPVSSAATYGNMVRAL